MHDTPTPAEAHEILQLVRQLAADVHALRQADERKTGGALSGADRAALTILLPAIADAFGDLHFTTRELFRYANAKDDILMAEIARACGPVTTGTVRRLGKLLTRAAGFALDDLRVVRVGDERDGAVWSVVRV